MQTYFNWNLNDFDHIKTELAHLLKDRKDDIPDRDGPDLYAIFKTIHCRKRINHDDPFGEKNIAQQLASYIPKASMVELKRRAKKRDVEAILYIADCYMFRFKKVEKNMLKASEWYTKALRLGSPEAMMSMVYGAFGRLVNRRGETLANHKPIFLNLRSSEEADYFGVIFNNLNEAAHCNFMSPLLLILASEYQEQKIISSWQLPENVKVILAKLKADEAARAVNSDFLCSSLNCVGIRECGSSQIICDHCKIVSFVVQ
jgi:hypothetical protein